MKKITKVLMLLLMVLPLALFSCGSPVDPPKEPENPNPDSGKTEEVSFSFWHSCSDADKEYYEDCIKEFTEANPHVKIDFVVLDSSEKLKDQVTNAMSLKNPPDLFLSWGGGILAEHAAAGLLKDITADVQADADLSSISSGALGLFQYNGKQYGVPYDLGAFTFWYNKDILKNAGYNSFPTDWADFVEMCKKIKDNGKTPIAVAAKDKWPAMHFFSYLALRIGGAEALSGFDVKGSMPAGFQGFNNQAFKEAADILLDFCKKGYFQDDFFSTDQNGGALLVGRGDAAMELMGQWAPGTQQINAGDSYIGDKLATAPFPVMSGKNGKITEVIGGGNGFEVGKNAPKEAVEFLKFIMKKENLSKYATKCSIIPTVKGVNPKDTNLQQVKKIVDDCTYYQLYLDQWLSSVAAESLNNAVYDIMMEVKEPESALATLQETYATGRPAPEKYDVEFTEWLQPVKFEEWGDSYGASIFAIDMSYNSINFKKDDIINYSFTGTFSTDIDKLNVFINTDDLKGQRYTMCGDWKKNVTIKAGQEVTISGTMTLEEDALDTISTCVTYAKEGNESCVFVPKGWKGTVHEVDLTPYIKSCKFEDKKDHWWVGVWIDNAEGFANEYSISKGDVVTYKITGTFTTDISKLNAIYLDGNDGVSEEWSKVFCELNKSVDIKKGQEITIICKAVCEDDLKKNLSFDISYPYEYGECFFLTKGTQIHTVDFTEVITSPVSSIPEGDGRYRFNFDVRAAVTGMSLSAGDIIDFSLSGSFSETIEISERWISLDQGEDNGKTSYRHFIDNTKQTIPKNKIVSFRDYVVLAEDSKGEADLGVIFSMDSSECTFTPATTTP